MNRSNLRYWPLLVGVLLIAMACSTAPVTGPVATPPTTGPETSEPVSSSAPLPTSTLPSALPGGSLASPEPSSAQDVCSLLTDAEVTAVIGVPIARHESQGNLTQGSCIKGTERVAFGGSMEGISLVSFSVTRGATLADLGPGSDLDPQPVSGLGDEAVFVPLVGLVVGVSDGVLFTITVVRGGGTANGGSYGSEAEVVGLARLLISRL
jgi:hypothetical protein